MACGRLGHFLRLRQQRKTHSNDEYPVLCRSGNRRPGFGAGRSGGIGGLANATASASSSTGAPIQINLTQRMGDGGDGLGGASGAMAAIPMPTTVSTVSSNGPLTLAGESYGGNGGGSAGRRRRHSWERLHQCLFSHTADLLTASNAYGGNGGLVTAGVHPTRRQRPGLPPALSPPPAALRPAFAAPAALQQFDGATNAGQRRHRLTWFRLRHLRLGQCGRERRSDRRFGGIAFGSGNAGHGGSVSTSNSIDGDAVPTSNIRFQLSATGGNGGISNSGSAGNGGNAQSSLSRTKNVQSLEVTTKSFGGWGGDRTSYFGAAATAAMRLPRPAPPTISAPLMLTPARSGATAATASFSPPEGNGGDASASTVSTGVGDTRASFRPRAAMAVQVASISPAARQLHLLLNNPQCQRRHARTDFGLRHRHRRQRRRR